MAAERKPLAKQRRVDEMLDFGPDEAPQRPIDERDLTRRLKRLLEEIQEISRRVDQLTARR